MNGPGPVACCTLSAMRVFTLATALWLVCTGVASAQQLKPIPPFAFDLRGFYSGLGQDPVTAAALGVQDTDLPNRGLGAVAGIQIYLLRRGGFAFGIGGETMMAHGKAQQQDAVTGDPVGLPIVQNVRSLSGQVSLNFGHRYGWSYISVGMGPLTFATYQGDTAPADPAPSASTPNFGGGARWFSNEHLAFCFDVRFYQTAPSSDSPVYPPRQRMRLLVMSAGISIK
jgi:hypothetical protein